MQNLYYKPTMALLMPSLFIIALFIPDLSNAYGSRHHGYYGYSGYGHYGYSRHYRYRKYGSHGYYPKKHYRRQYYPSRYYATYPKFYNYSAPVYTQLNNASNGSRLSSKQSEGVNSLAWLTLVQGKYSEALSIFAKEAQSNPNSGIPKVGYALATAIGGDLERGIWAMRRAFQIDPDSLHYLQLDKNGHLLIDNLIGQYSSQKNRTDDQTFMLSALHYLKHDYAVAKKSIVNVNKYGNKSSSSTNLERLIEQY